MTATLTDSNFQEFVTTNKVALVDFTATWCGPCQMLKPIVDELSSEFDGKAGVAKLDIDDNREMASQLRIMSVPTVMIFKDGQPVDTIVGLRPKQDYASKLNELLA